VRNFIGTRAKNGLNGRELLCHVESKCTGKWSKMQKLRPRSKMKPVLIFNFSKYGRIFELFEKIDFRTFAGEEWQNN